MPRDRSGRAPGGGPHEKFRRERGITMAPRNIPIASIAAASALALTLLAGCGTNASATGSPPASEADLARVLEQFGLDSGNWAKVTESESNDLFASGTTQPRLLGR